jgi:hypothetical protein
MKLSCISPGSEGYDLRTFDCEKCVRSKSFVSKSDSATSIKVTAFTGRSTKAASELNQLAVNNRATPLHSYNGYN